MNKPLVINNGVYLRTTEYNTTSHMDSADLHNLNRGRAGVTDLGVVTPFVTTGFLLNPQLYTFSGMGKNRVEVDGHTYTFKHPVAERPFYIVEDLSGTDRPGIGGEKFKLKFNTKKYDNGYVLAYDMHDPMHFLVTEDEIVKDGDGFIYTLRLKTTGSNSKWAPKEMLAPGTVFFPVTTIETEFSQLYSSIPEFSGGMREYFNHVGYTRAQLHYSVTRDAGKGKIHHNCLLHLDQLKEVIEMYSFREGSLGYDLNLQGQSPLGAYTAKYGSKGEKQMMSDIVERAWVPKVDAIATSMLEMFVETEAIFGSGGTIEWDGKGRYQTALGLFHQLNMGNTHSFNLYNFTLTKFEYILANQLKDKVEPFSGNVIKIATGRGGYAWVKNQLRGLPSSFGMVWSADNYVQGANKSGTNQDLHFASPDFVSYDMANGYGRVEFVLNPALDPVDANEKVNPMVPVSNGIGGHRLSSYMFIITDITQQDSDNVIELVYGPDWDTEKSVIVGKLPYMGQARMNGAYQRSNSHPGFQVMLEKRHKAYFLKDATKSLLIKPINPYTGRPIFTGYFQ